MHATHQLASPLTAPDRIPTMRTGPGERLLRRQSTASRYHLRLASSREDVRAAQFLRFAVFNLELNEGLEESYATFLDADPFDAVCDHLLVEDATSNNVVGTYRLQTGATAAANLGYYSDQEFDLSPYEYMRRQVIELGRACVDRSHRNLTVLGLLWKGIAQYAEARGGRYLLGCSSLPTVDPALGAAAYSTLRPHQAPEVWQTQPKPRFAFPVEGAADTRYPLPKLLRAYLSLGARVCGPPALDREFRTVDFLTILDLNSLDPAIRSRLGT